MFIWDGIKKRTKKRYLRGQLHACFLNILCLTIKTNNTKGNDHLLTPHESYILSLLSIFSFRQMITKIHYFWLFNATPQVKSYINIIRTRSKQHGHNCFFQFNLSCFSFCFEVIATFAKMGSSSTPVLKRSDTIADSMPDALRQSRFHMKKCFARYYSICHTL